MGSGIMEAGAAPLDGITIIEFDDPGAQRDIASGNHLVTFISARGSFAAVVTDPTGQRSICTSLAVPESYTGTSIAFGWTPKLPFENNGMRHTVPPLRS